MAPRETRVESGAPTMLNADAAKRLTQSLEVAAKPYVPPTASKAKPVVTPEAPLASMASAETKQQVAALQEAAKEGTPFCEECEKAAAAASNEPAAVA